MKTKWDSNVTDHTGVVYVENETKLPCLIGLGAINDEN